MRFWTNKYKNDNSGDDTSNSLCSKKNLVDAISSYDAEFAN